MKLEPGSQMYIYPWELPALKAYYPSRKGAIPIVIQGYAGGGFDGIDYYDVLAPENMSFSIPRKFLHECLGYNSNSQARKLLEKEY